MKKKLKLRSLTIHVDDLVPSSATHMGIEDRCMFSHVFTTKEYITATPKKSLELSARSKKHKCTCILHRSARDTRAGKIWHDLRRTVGGRGTGGLLPLRAALREPEPLHLAKKRPEEDAKVKIKSQGWKIR